ncbi:MAG: hypothetical protein ACRDJW_18220 [Thermomicrobiales bacterium]
MCETASNPADAGAVAKILSSKGAAASRFSDSERGAIAAHHRALADRRWTESLHARSEALHHHALLHAVQDQEVGSLRNAVTWGPVSSQIVEQARPRNARTSGIGQSPIGCDAHRTSPPYALGDPLQEDVGVGATVLVSDDPVAPVFAGVVPDLNNLKTFSQLALPNDGKLSLGVGLGKVRVGANVYTLHPPAMEFPQTFPIRGGLLEVTNAKASLGYHLAVLPGAPLQVEKLLKVAVDIIVGEQSRPFYLVNPPAMGPPILQAFGVAHLVVSSSDGGVAEDDVVFLEHREGAFQIFGTPTVMREFSIAQTLTLLPGTRWVYVGIEVRLEVHRWFILPPPPDVEDREGFVMIDLRSPAHNTQPIHHLLAPGGSVNVPHIGMTICRPDEVFA